MIVNDNKILVESIEPENIVKELFDAALQHWFGNDKVVRVEDYNKNEIVVKNYEEGAIPCEERGEDVYRISLDLDDRYVYLCAAEDHTIDDDDYYDWYSVKDLRFGMDYFEAYRLIGEDKYYVDYFGFDERYNDEGVLVKTLYNEFELDYSFSWRKWIVCWDFGKYGYKEFYTMEEAVKFLNQCIENDFKAFCEYKEEEEEECDGW